MSSVLYILSVPNQGRSVEQPRIHEPCGCKVDLIANRGRDSLTTDNKRFVRLTTTMKTGHPNASGSNCTYGKQELLRMKFGPTRTVERRPPPALVSLPVERGDNSVTHNHHFCNCETRFSVRRKEDTMTQHGRTIITLETNFTVELCKAECKRSRDSIATWGWRIPPTEPEEEMAWPLRPRDRGLVAELALEAAFA